MNLTTTVLSLKRRIVSSRTSSFLFISLSSLMTILGTLGASNSMKEQLAEFILSRFVAHRGANNEAPGNHLPHFPENTLHALREAYAQGSHYVECDVHMTQDNKIIVLHDSTLRRTARYHPGIASTLSLEEFNKLIDRGVDTLSYTDVISQVDVGSYVNDLDPIIRPPTKVPLFEEFLNELQNHPERKLLVEIKAGCNVAIVDVIKQSIEDNSKDGIIKTDQLIIISFDLKVLQRSKLLLPDYKAIFLLVTTMDSNEVVPHPNNLSDHYTGLYHRIQSQDDLNRLIHITKQAKLDGLGIEYDSSLIDANFLQRIKDNNLLSYIWTYPKDDNLGMALHMLNSGADLIATNQPQQIFQQLLNITHDELKEYGLVSDGKLKNYAGSSD